MLRLYIPEAKDHSLLPYDLDHVKGNLCYLFKNSLALRRFEGITGMRTSSRKYERVYFRARENVDSIVVIQSWG